MFKKYHKRQISSKQVGFFSLYFKKVSENNHIIIGVVSMDLSKKIYHTI